MTFDRRYYAGGGSSTALASSMSSGDTSFTLVGDAGWPGGTPGANFIVVVDRGTTAEEKILCASNTGLVVAVVTRGYDGTSAVAHNAAATVSLCGGAIDFDEANQITHLFGNGVAGSILSGGGTGVLATWVSYNVALTVSANAVTVPVTNRESTVTNNAAGSVAITITTSGAFDGQPLIVRFYDYSGVAQTLSWVNTENSLITVPLISNGSTTLPLTVGFVFNGATSLWRCMGAV